MSVRLFEKPQSDTARTALVVFIGSSIALVGFGDSLLELVRRWIQQEEYSHGFLIPFIAAWLLWRRREALTASIGQPSWTGPAVISLALVMHIVGELSAIFILSQVAFVVALIGLVLSVGGYSLLRAAFVPIVFLLFAIPMPYFIDTILSFKLQLISSELGTLFIRMFQIPVYLDGNIIDMGDYKLQVAEACSGLRYLYPLLSLSFLAAYLFKAPTWQRALVFFSSVPITIVMNGVRIGVVGVTVDHWGIQAADGMLHFFEGWVIFIACGIVLVLEIYCLALISGRPFVQVFGFPSVSAKATPKPGARSAFVPVTSLFLLCVAGLMVTFITGRTEIIPDRLRFIAFPERIGPWQGRTSALDPGIERGLGFDDYILSDYERSDGDPVNLYVAYYASQRKGESPHSPIVCIPGGGWAITKFDRTSYDDEGTRLLVNRVIIEKDSIKQLVYYWFDERGRNITNEFLAKWYLFADSIVMNRTDAALIRITTQVHAGESEANADERVRAFIRDAAPTLSEYLPPKTISQAKSNLTSNSRAKT